jgi:hypothetical protein
MCCDCPTCLISTALRERSNVHTEPSRGVSMDVERREQSDMITCAVEE